MTAADVQRSPVSVVCGIDPLERSAAPRAEQRLLLAVLEEAVWTFQRYVDSENSRGLRLLSEVETWFGSDDTTWTFAFVPLCDALGFDPAYLRSGLRRWRDERRRLTRTVYRPAAPPAERRSRHAVAACGMLNGA